jgi:hypothetical protein
MARKQSDDSFSEGEVARRLETILKGAFAGAPTPLKEIPTRDGTERAARKDQRRPRRRRQRKKRAA